MKNQNNSIYFGFIFLIILLITTNVVSFKLYTKEKQKAVELEKTIKEQSQSIGVLAGKAVLDFRQKTQANYEAVQKQTEEALATLRETGNEMLVSMNLRLETARAEMEDSAQKMLTNFQEELEKFKQTLHENNPDDNMVKTNP